MPFVAFQSLGDGELQMPCDDGLPPRLSRSERIDRAKRLARERLAEIGDGDLSRCLISRILNGRLILA